MSLAFVEHHGLFTRNVNAEDGGHRLFTVQATPGQHFAAVSITSGAMHFSMTKREAVALARALVDAVKELS